ncbi:unnamed protein product [Lathyrus oleraceus]|uniref:Dynein light chain n=1 Tax=Pisum sativum TaxID=3888 RepID=A0A9D4XAL5_PEA|nr:uncharacterized protein LOC127073862 [Pisum sativum]XP_050871060.1 uncharacterized protein LOC127073862 [Pisum sativum]KAI5416868.1 hypothetical protein KIW84_041751 [Pisum sativum]
MAHRSSRRRNTAPPESTPPSAPGGPPVPAKQPRPTIFSPSPSHYTKPNSDLIQATKSSFLVKPFQSLNLGSKKTKHSQTKHVDSRLQTKSMTTSAIFESSKPNKTHNAQNTVLTPKLEKESIFLTSKKTHKEKPHKPGSELERWKLQGLLKNEKKESCKGCVVEDVKDVKDEKSRKVAVVEEANVVKERVSVPMGQSGGRRKSLCGSMVDLGDFFAINGAKMVSADMPPFMQIHAVDCARKAVDSMEKFTSKTLASSLKKEFDGVYGPAWHCIVGTSFGSFVTHSVGGFLYFSMDQKLYILLFKTAVQKAD